MQVCSNLSRPLIGRQLLLEPLFSDSSLLEPHGAVMAGSQENWVPVLPVLIPSLVDLSRSPPPLSASAGLLSFGLRDRPAAVKACHGSPQA